MALQTEAAHTHAHTDEHQHIHGGPLVYAGVLGGLLVLTIITVGASYIDWGGGMTNVIIAMLIASIKASLVALFFMHLRWDKPLSAIIFCTSLFFLGLFLVGCYSDTISRSPSEPANLRGPAPGGMMQAQPGQIAPGGQTNAPPIPGASPAGSHGGAAAGTNAPPEGNKH
jgi:cytochrome c oxidase subunit IV